MTTAYLRAALCATFVLGWALPAHAQDFTLRYLDLNDLYHTPALVTLSPNFQTTLAFDGLAVERVSTGRADQIIAEVVDDSIRLRANTNVVNTDLTVTAGGRTALFILQSDPASDAPRHYLVREKPATPRGPPAARTPSTSGQGTGTSDAKSGSKAVSNASGGATEGSADLSSTYLGSAARRITSIPGTDFQATVYRNGPEVVIQYVLSNVGDDSLHVDPQRLKLRYGDVELPFTLWRAPERNEAVRLEPGRSEYGTLVLTDPPQDAGLVELAWVLSRIGSSTFGTLEWLLELPEQEAAR